MKVHLWVITLFVSFASIETLSCKRDTKCRVSRIRSMKAADCYNKELITFSQCLPKDVEIVDLSHNRIRKLAKDDLKRYSDIKMLYLNDNLIAVIDKETFEDKDYLQTLDLSLNAITKLPALLFHLPSLQSLYLGQNLNMNIVDVVEKTKPITSPLFNLDISYVMGEEPSELPDFGLMPTLERYNISGNRIISMSTRHFAGLCSLKLLDTSNATIEYEDDRCDCWTINRWLKIRKVNFEPFTCSIKETECGKEVPLQDLKLYEDCIIEVRENLKKAKIRTILLIILPICGIVTLSVMLYFFLKKKQKQKRKMDSTQQIMLNNAVSVKT